MSVQITTTRRHRPGVLRSRGLLAFATGLLAGLWLDNLRRTRRAERRDPPEGSFVELGRGRLHYVERGSGPPLILIHGAAYLHGDMLDGPLGARLRQRYRCISFDRPGHGYSSEYPFHMAPQHQADLLRKAVRRLGVRRPILMGHSLGGAVALAYAARYPDEVAGVVTLAPQAFPKATAETVGFGLLGAVQGLPPLDRTISPVLGRLGLGKVIEEAFRPQEVPRSFLESAPAGLLTRPVQIRSTSQEILVDLPSMMALARQYRRIRAPMAALAGTGDVVLDAHDQAGRLARTVPGTRLHLLPGLGHMLHYFAPEAVMAALADVRMRAGL